MEPLIKIHFQKLRAKDYPDIIKRCKHFSIFTQRDKNELEISSVNELMRHWTDFMAIATRVTQFFSSRGWFMGDEIIPFKSDFFFKIQDTIEYCYKGYHETSYQSHYCKSDWGCKRLMSIRKEINSSDKLTSQKHWYRYGHFEGGHWLIDKGAILSALKKEAESNFLEACPVFDFEKIKKAVDELPDEIELNDQWQILKRTELRKEGFVEIPFSIAPAWIKIDDEKPGHLLFEVDLNIKPKINPEYMTEEEINRFLDEMNKKRH
jgi:hypothetical protein